MSSIASALASAIQSQDSAFLQAAASGAAISLTSTESGTIANWAISTSVTYDTTHFSSASFSAPASGMSGGTNAQYGQRVAYNYSIPEPSGSTCASTGFGYDCAGNVKTVVDSVTGGWGYSYDTLNRLTAATGQSGNYSSASLPVAGVGLGWSYDPFGNVNAQNSTSPNFRTSWAHFTTADNRASATMTAPGGPVYDASGDVTNDGVNQYAYDAEGRVCAVYNGTSYTGYVYDADGARVAKGAVGGLNCNLSSNGFQISYSYVLDSGGRDLSQVNGSGQWQFSNVYANGQLLATYSTQNSDTYFGLNDWLGTKRAEVSPDGCLETYASLPFGDDLTPNGNCADAAPLHFTGKERDAESGNDYFGARYYASSMGRWLSPDWSAKASPVPFATFGDPQSLNLYSYVRNNPLTNSDADGHCDIGCAFSIAWGVFQGIQRDGGVGNYSKNLGIGVLKGAGSAVVNTLKLAAAGTNPGAIAAAVLSPGPKALQPSNTTQAQASIATQIVGPAVVGMAAGPLLGAAGAGESAASGLPATVARAIPASIDATTLGAPGASDVFVTSGGALNGMTSSQISSGLTIPESSSGFNIFEFPTPDGIASPINRTNPGFVGGGQTAGGLPEYVVPNGPIPANATKTFVPPSQ